MDEDNFPNLLKAFIVITLFSFLLLVTVIKLSGGYGTDTTIINERIGLDALNSTLSSTEATAQGWQDKFSAIGSEDSIFQKIFDILGFLGVGLFGVTKTMATFIFLPFGIFANILSNVLGVPAIVVAIITVLIILTVVFGIWSLLKRGI